MRTSAGDSRADERVELLVPADGELEVAGGYAFYAQVFRHVSCVSQARSVSLYHALATCREGRTCELEDFCSEIFKDRGGVYRGFGAYADVVLRALLEVPVDTAHGELQRARAGKATLAFIHRVRTTPQYPARAAKCC